MKGKRMGLAMRLFTNVRLLTEAGIAEMSLVANMDE
jgi:hypothetical protein